MILSHHGHAHVRACPTEPHQGCALKDTMQCYKALGCDIWPLIPPFCSWHTHELLSHERLVMRDLLDCFILCDCLALPCHSSIDFFNFVTERIET